jgi:hypothetical protein
MSSRTPNPHGHPVAAAAVVGSFAFAMALVMRAAGLLGEVEAGLARGYAARGFGEYWEASQPWWDLALVALLVYGLVWLLFETPGVGRRVIILVSSAVVVLILSPVLALWGTFWSPLNVVLGMVWGGFCAIMWARQHPMPCERPAEQEPEFPPEGKIIPMTPEPADPDDEEEEMVAEEEVEAPAVAEASGGPAPGGPASGGASKTARTRKRGRGRGKARRSRRK